MTRYFKSKKILRRKELFKYIIILIITYLSLKFSIYFIHVTKLFHYVFMSNKVEKITTSITDKTFNQPLNILEVNNKNNINLSSNPVFSSKDKIVAEIIKPKIYIYNSHPLEAYLENNRTVYDMDYIFKDTLSKYNVDVLVEDSDINNFLVLNNLDYGYSYIASRHFIEENITNNNFNLIIDLHRDATRHDDTYIEINNKPCVKILFVVGALNSNYELNYNLALTLNDIINQKYPNLSRGVMLKKGPNVNGLYNQDLSDKMILLELGGNNNTEQEVINTIELISEIIGEYLYGNQSI